MQWYWTKEMRASPGQLLKLMVLSPLLGNDAIHWIYFTDFVQIIWGMMLFFILSDQYKVKIWLLWIYNSS